jgi:hypothetical protein
MWIIQWRGPMGRSGWRKAYPIEFASEAEATAYFAQMFGPSGNPNFRVVPAKRRARG